MKAIVENFFTDDIKKQLHSYSYSNFELKKLYWEQLPRLLESVKNKLDLSFFEQLLRATQRTDSIVHRIIGLRVQNLTEKYETVINKATEELALLQKEFVKFGNIEDKPDLELSQK